MRSPDMDKLRGVVIGLSEGGQKELSNALIFRALALETEPEKARVRRQLGTLVKQSELERIEPGVYRYNPKAQSRRKGEGYIRMWRAVRAMKGAYTIADISAVAHMDASTVSKYMKYLSELGFVRRNGKQGNSMLYSTTPKGREQRETPYPPLAIRDPFADERAAMSRLARVFFEKDLYTDSARKAVLKECGTIIKRFDTQHEKGGHHEN